MKKKCLNCKKDYLGRTASKYCSMFCNGASQKTRIDTACLRCGNYFFVIPAKLMEGRGKYCSRICKTVAQKDSIPWNKGIKMPQTTGTNHFNWKGGKPHCLDCGKRLSKYGIEKCTTCFNKGFRGSGHPGWKGGRIMHEDGYVYIFSPTHPRKDHHGYVFEHRLAMEQGLGRYLSPLEHVHHVNGIKNDNRIQNLQVVSNSEHLKLEWKNSNDNGLKRSKQTWFKEGQIPWNKKHYKVADKELLGIS